MITLKPNEKRPFPMLGRYLVVRYAEPGFAISAPEKGIQGTPLQTADTIELNGINSILLENTAAADIEVDVQSSTFKIEANSGGAVTINGGSIDSIKESISVTASSTVEDGSIKQIVSDQMAPIADVSIAPGVTTQFVPSRAVKNRKVIMQVISDTFGPVRISNSGTIADTEGLFCAGSLNSPGIVELDTETPIFVKNIGTSAAKITGLEVWRA